MRAVGAFVIVASVAMLVGVQCTHHSCSISGSSYDQSCTQTSDCVEELAGDYCRGGCACGTTAINVRAQKQYESDLNDALGSGHATYCPCPAQGNLACVHGTCVIQIPVWTPPDAGTD